MLDAISPAQGMGRPLAQRQNTFALGEGQLKVVDRLRAFRKFCTVLADHLPYIKEGDIVMLREPSEHMNGEADVLAVKHVRIKNNVSKTALVLRLREGELDEKEDYDNG